VLFRSKILIGFLSIIILIFIQAAITYKLQSAIFEDTKQINNVETPLEMLVVNGQESDEVKTQIFCAASLFAQKGEYEFAKIIKTNYYDPANNSLISVNESDRAEILINLSKRSKELKIKANELFHKINENRIKLTAIESQAFEAIEKKDFDTAISLVIGEEYKKHKVEMIQDTIDWKAFEDEISLAIRNDILKNSQQAVYLNLGISIIIIIMVILTMLIMRSFFAKKEGMIIEKEKELKVREKMEQTYKILFENATEAIFIADVETRQLVDCNQSAENLMGYSRDKLLSMKADELHPADKIKETMKGFQEQAEGKIESVFTEVLSRDNKRIPVKINASAVEIDRKSVV
jgi:PAS domain S-box-containing protein